jgi:radical SAM superfamily enzyme YgiQ (UPF0313 family)
MDELYDLPFNRMPHPSYDAPIPAFETVKHSVVVMRGCFGGCTFCSITEHEGRIIQNRSAESVLREVRELRRMGDFRGTITDLGGPTANMYKMKCRRRTSKPLPQAVVCSPRGLRESRDRSRAGHRPDEARCERPRASITSSSRRACGTTWRSGRPSTSASWRSTTSAVT